MATYYDDSSPTITTDVAAIVAGAKRAPEPINRPLAKIHEFLTAVAMTSTSKRVKASAVNKAGALTDFSIAANTDVESVIDTLATSLDTANDAIGSDTASPKTGTYLVKEKVATLETSVGTSADSYSTTKLWGLTKTPTSGAGLLDALPVGVIIMWANGSLPSDKWALCDGNDGRPDLNGRVPLGTSAISSTVGTESGASTITLSEAQMPEHVHAPHLHTLMGNSVVTGGSPGIPAGGSSFSWINWAQAGDNSSSTGGGEAHSNMQPSTTVHFIIKIS
jgi:hypothetical protein